MDTQITAAEDQLDEQIRELLDHFITSLAQMAGFEGEMVRRVADRIAAEYPGFAEAIRADLELGATMEQTRQGADALIEDLRPLAGMFREFVLTGDIADKED